LQHRLGDQTFGKGQNFVDFVWGEYAADSAGMNDGKRGLDQVTLFDTPAFNQKITKQFKKLKLMAVKHWAQRNELIDRFGNRIWETLEDFDSEDVTDKANE
jgi:hypothetical protein